jgi:HEAT repeat protein
MVLAALMWTIAAKGQGLGRAASALGVLLQLGGSPVAASAAVLSEHEMEEINAMTPQDQAMRLLERTINHYAGAGEEIGRRSEGWIGQIHSTPQLEEMTNTAYFSSDLRVRAAALEIWLARDQLHKTPETVDELIRAAAVAPRDKKWFLLSSLGILGGRGIEPEKVFDTLFLAVHDPDAAIRGSAINGLGLLGAESTIAPLLEVFHSDPSADLRERAACNLADSGMLSRELRQKAVPELVRFSQDPSLDAETRKWVFQALREITQQKFGNDPSRWVSWWGSQAGRQ